jgi:heptosyltransferase-2
MKKIKKILILRFGAIGDVVHSTGLFRGIKRKHPDVSIHYVTFKTPAENIKNDPELDKVWIAEGKSYKQLHELAKQLREERFDAFLNLQPGIRTRIFSLMSCIPKTITYRKTFKLHAVENFWLPGKVLFPDIELDGRLYLHIDPLVKEKVTTILDKKGLVIAFNMGVSATRQGRRWSQDYWSELAKGFFDRHKGCKIVLTGSSEDAEFSEVLLGISPDVISFCGKLSVEENTALLSLCNLVISGDTGPLHIATAVGTPAIGLYGAAPISRTGPYGENCTALKSDRACAPCNRRKCKYIKENEVYTPCMLDISPDMVLTAAEKFL